MKILLNNPFVAVEAMGGATFEPGLGWWSQASEKDHQQLGNPFCSERDAIYIPTLQKNGQPVAEEVVHSLKTQASALGLTSLTQAAGMWVLSETGEVQTETIWIAFSSIPIVAEKRPALRALAETTKILANQDEVAREENGRLLFTAFELEAVEFEISSLITPSSRLWVVPISDLETVEARNLLLQVNETVISFPGWWGMKWEQIPTSFQDEIQKFRSENPNGEILGVKLAGDCEWTDKIIEPYRPGQKSPLKKVAEIVGQQLTEYQNSVVANTTTWIPGLQSLGLAQGIVDAIRLTDRASQGVNPDQEAQAVRAWENRTEIEQLTIVRMAHSKCAIITDRYFGQYKNLLILSEDSEVNFYGDGALCSELQKKFEGWAGGAGLGQKKGFAFWGGYPNHQEVQSFILEFLK
ncbi:MAG: hypothetical protein WC928_02250 [Patescibacteria group bacterium]|jgi:hypothetical protein